jgi:hypothetical protein
MLSEIRKNSEEFRILGCAGGYATRTPQNPGSFYGNSYDEHCIISSSRKGLDVVYLVLIEGDQVPCPSPHTRLLEQYDLSKC